MEQLAEYIRQQRLQNLTDQQIRQALITSGWNASQVDAALGSNSVVPASGAPLTPALPPSKEPVNRFGLIMMVVVIVGIVIISLGIVLATHHHTNSPGAKHTGQQASGSSVTCTSESCFTPKFSSCSPAILNFQSQIASVHYEINSSKGSECNMLFEYTANPNSAWVNQPMTCDFNNKKDLDSSVSDVINNLLAKSNTYDCTGPLVAILQAQ